MFTQKPQEPSAWAALPGEPLDRDDDLLPESPTDPFGLGLGTTSATSVAIPVLPPEAPLADSEPASEERHR